MRSIGRSGDSLSLSRNHEADSTGLVVSIVQVWHDDEPAHPGAFSTCDLQPCNAVYREVAAQATSSTKKGSS